MSTQLVVVGSVALDTIKTPFDQGEDLLGGSVSYACAAASYFAPTGMVGVVGDDFPDAYMDIYRGFGVDLTGLQTVKGKTFRWSGVYDDDMINRQTISTDLNVFEDFSPDLPADYRTAPLVLLGNITPKLQLDVLSQVEAAEFVVADTMDLWINIARPELVEVIKKVNMLTLNDSEARLLTGEYNMRQAAEVILDMGPEYVAIKKGEHGAMLVSRQGIFLVPAYPVDKVVDPTGAGDSFAGGMMGYLAECGTVNDANMREALLRGSVVASFGVEVFSLDRLIGLTRDDIDSRLNDLKGMMRVGS
jgi:sugar/nucleoside kinase (ribokinase family)